MNKQQPWHLWTEKAPDHDVELYTNATGTIEVNGHPVTGPEPIRIPKEWLKDGETVVKTNSPLTYLRMEV